MERTITVRGVELTGTDGEVRMRDLDIGTKIQLAQPRNIRATIKKLEKEGKLPGIQTRTVRVRVARKGRGEVEIESKEYWLTRAQALKVIAKCETEVADAILDEVIAIYEAAVDGLLAPPAPPAVDPALAARVAQLEAGQAQMVAAFAALPGAIAQAVESAVERTVKAIAPVMAPSPDVSIIGRHGARYVTASLRMYGEMMANKDGMTTRQWSNKAQQDLRGALGYAGTGRRWELFPMARYGELQQALDGLLSTARQVATDRQASAQMSLPVGLHDRVQAGLHKQAEQSAREL